ncbi:hypothetical protein Tco_0693659, partial [Tanacetum coccineum]
MIGRTRLCLKLYAELLGFCLFASQTDSICKPKEQGGLGLKDLGVWNEVLMTKRLWNVVVKKDTLWIKQIYKEKLKDKSIWEAECDSNCTMGWKNILSLRVKIRKHVRWKVGNGRSVNVWHENWCSVSPLSDYIDSRDIYNARLNNNCTINDIINEGRWNWPEEWKSDFVELNQIQVPNLNEDVEDTVVCVSENNVWKDLKCNGEKMEPYISEMISLPINRNIWSIVRRIVLNAAVYFIWQERNHRLFNNEKNDKETIINLIKEITVMKLMGLRVKDSNTVKEVE